MLAGKVSHTYFSSSNIYQHLLPFLDKLKITDTQLSEQSPEMLLLAIKAAMDDPIHNMVVSQNIVTPGNKIQSLAKSCYETLRQERKLLLEMSTDIVAAIGNILQETSFSDLKSRESMWSLVLEILQDQKWYFAWSDLVGKCEYQNKSVFSGFFRFIVFDIMTSIIKFANNQRKSSNEQALDLRFSKEEEEIVYYVSGYIVYSLIKRYTRLSAANTKHKGYRDIFQLLGSLRTENSDLAGNSLSEYAKKWTQIQSRGGLIEVNDDMFLFIKRIECVVRGILNVKLIIAYKNEDLREVIERKVLENSAINQLWESLARHLVNEQLKIVLKDQIIRKWVDIRANAFVTTYVQITKLKMRKEKRESTLSRASEPSLRKTLSK